MFTLCHISGVTLNKVITLSISRQKDKFDKSLRLSSGQHSAGRKLSAFLLIFSCWCIYPALRKRAGFRFPFPCLSAFHKMQIAVQPPNCVAAQHGFCMTASFHQCFVGIARQLLGRWRSVRRCNRRVTLFHPLTGGVAPAKPARR